MKTITVVHCWSAPLSRSTALLYSFDSRGDDCVAIDGPLYCEWLIARGDAASRPYRQQLIDGTAPPDASNDDSRWKERITKPRGTVEQRI